MFQGEFTRYQKGKRCTRRKDNILAKFPLTNDTRRRAEDARNECEHYCRFKDNCWGCSVDCDETCRWNAIEDCGTKEEWIGLIDGDISQSRGNVYLINMLRNCT